jgi:hypothetical protein
MQSLVNKILKILKDHVNQNNEEIQYNQDEINRIISDLKANLAEKDLEYKNALNKELLEENEDFIQLQLQISEFMEKYGHLFPADNTEEEEESFEINESLPYFRKTIEGEIDFGPEHPQYNNIRFFNELLRYYEEREDYEKCDQLIRLKKVR